MQRIMIIGASGAGKSTLARALGERLGLPVVHGDPFFFHPGWVPREKAETAALFNAAAMQDRWIIDGNNSSTMEFRAERADLIIYLELGRLRRLARTLLRTLRYWGRARPDMAPGCPERFDAAFQFDWVWNFDRHSGPKMAKFLTRWDGKRRILRLASPQAVREYLASL